MRSALLALLLAPFLAGCPALDVLEGKESPYKAAQEARAAVLVPEPVVAAVAAPEPEPRIEPTPEPECVPVFRVTTCD